MAALNDPTSIVDIEKVKKWFSQSKRDGVNIVVVGETGVGKSTLINGLVGKDVMPTRHAASAVTQRVIKYEHGKYIRIFDTPGFFSFKSSMAIGDIVQQIADETEGKIDLLVYCLNMNRITEQTTRGIGYVADILCTQKNTSTPSWKNVLFVLTRANQVESSMMQAELAKPDQPVDPSAVKRVETQFEKFYHELCKDIREETEAEARRRKQLSCNAKGIPVVAAGYLEAALPIPGCECWLSNLWAVAYSRVNKAAYPAFLEATVLDRLQPPGVGPDLSEQLPSQRRICNDEIATLNRSQRAPAVVMAALCTAGGAAGGAVIAGPVGAFIGGTAGAAVGGIVGAASYAAYKAFISDSE